MRVRSAQLESSRSVGIKAAQQAAQGSVGRAGHPSGLTPQWREGLPGVPGLAAGGGG